MEKLEFGRSKQDLEVLKEMKQEYLNNPVAVNYIQGLGIPEEEIDDNITTIYDFVMDLNYCKHCPGVEKCAKENPLFCTKIVYENGKISRTLTPCKKYIEKMSFEKLLLNKDFDNTLTNKTIKDLDQTEPRKKAVMATQNIIRNKKNVWMYFYGAMNSGKSYTATIIALTLARKNLGPISFINSPMRIRELNDLSFKNKERFQELLELYSTVPVLVLDDFGNEFKNDFIRDAIVFNILSARASKKLITIFTSDFTIDEIATLYGTSKAGELRAKQIASLIKNNVGEAIDFGSISIY